MLRYKLHPPASGLARARLAIACVLRTTVLWARCHGCIGMFSACIVQRLSTNGSCQKTIGNGDIKQVFEALQWFCSVELVDLREHEEAVRRVRKRNLAGGNFLCSQRRLISVAETHHYTAETTFFTPAWCNVVHRAPKFRFMRSIGVTFHHRTNI